MTRGADERIERLYALPREDFTAERNALAADLRREGDRETADVVKRLPKPSAAAWAVNQLVRSEPDLVEALLGAGGELRQAHRQATSGRGATQLRAAADAERAAVDALVSRAPAVLGRTPGAALAEAIRNTLHAASSDDAARERVASGTLETELRPIGLGPAGAQAGAARKEKERSARARASEHARALKAATADEKALRRELEAAERALARAEDANTRAREAAEAAAARARDARKRVRDARASLAEAQRHRSRLGA